MGIQEEGFMVNQKKASPDRSDRGWPFVG